MGLTSSLNKRDSLPSNLSFPDCKQILSDTKELLEQNKAELNLNLSVFLPSFKYHQQNWRVSKVIADICNFGTENGIAPEPHQITLDMEQVYKIHSLLKHFRKESLKQSEDRVTIGGQESDKQCCICFENKANIVLPCMHPFCPICTSKYIIDKEEHICPICRRSFHGSKNSIEKTLYEVIEEDKLLYEQARSQIVEMVAKYNVNVVRMLKVERQEKI